MAGRFVGITADRRGRPERHPALGSPPAHVHARSLRGAAAPWSRQAAECAWLAPRGGRNRHASLDAAVRRLPALDGRCDRGRHPRARARTIGQLSPADPWPARRGGGEDRARGRAGALAHLSDLLLGLAGRSRPAAPVGHRRSRARHRARTRRADGALLLLRRRRAGRGAARSTASRGRRGDAPPARRRRGRGAPSRLHRACRSRDAARSRAGATPAHVVRRTAVAAVAPQRRRERRRRGRRRPRRLAARDRRRWRSRRASPALRSTTCSARASSRLAGWRSRGRRWSPPPCSCGSPSRCRLAKAHASRASISWRSLRCSWPRSRSRAAPPTRISLRADEGSALLLLLLPGLLAVVAAIGVARVFPAIARWWSERKRSALSASTRRSRACARPGRRRCDGRLPDHRLRARAPRGGLSGDARAGGARPGGVRGAARHRRARGPPEPRPCLRRCARTPLRPTRRPGRRRLPGAPPDGRRGPRGARERRDGARPRPRRDRARRRVAAGVVLRARTAASSPTSSIPGTRSSCAGSGSPAIASFSASLRASSRSRRSFGCRTERSAASTIGARRSLVRARTFCASASREARCSSASRSCRRPGSSSVVPTPETRSSRTLRLSGPLATQLRDWVGVGGVRDEVHARRCRGARPLDALPELVPPVAATDRRLAGVGSRDSAARRARRRRRRHRCRSSSPARRSRCRSPGSSSGSPAPTGDVGRRRSRRAADRDQHGVAGRRTRERGLARRPARSGRRGRGCARAAALSDARDDGAARGRGGGAPRSTRSRNAARADRDGDRRTRPRVARSRARGSRGSARRPRRALRPRGAGLVPDVPAPRRPRPRSEPLGRRSRRRGRDGPGAARARDSGRVRHGAR